MDAAGGDGLGAVALNALKNPHPNPSPCAQGEGLFEYVAPVEAQCEA